MLAFGKTPILGVKELEDMGFKMVVAPIDSVLLTAKVMAEMAEVFKRDGHTQALADDMVRFDGIKKILGVSNFLSLRDELSKPH
jgi:2-methylisocitrate lyase-like PEP mutase family enzyme